VVTDPVGVFEVLSPTTASTDIGMKNEEYRDTPSVHRYVLLAQDRKQATMFERIGGDWVGHIVSGDALLLMPEIGIEVPLAELYADVSFGGEPEPGSMTAQPPG
jgi:Uma2 family endonuclease